MVRQADDLLVFLLDIATGAPEARWLALARAFLEDYGEEEVIGELRRHLAPPRHLEACHRHAERLRRMARRRATWSARHAAARTPIETNIAVALDTQRG